MEDIIARTFAPPDGPSGLIVYVGQKAECVLFCLPPVGPFDHLLPTPDLEPVVESKKKLKIVLSAVGEATSPILHVNFSDFFFFFWFLSQMESGGEHIPLGALAHCVYTDNRQVEGCTCLFLFHFDFWGYYFTSDPFPHRPPALSEYRPLIGS